MASEKQKFEAAANGYGFSEIEQMPDGIYCTGCCNIHKRPTKMYENMPIGKSGREVMCKSAIVRYYWSEEMSE